MFWWYRSRAPCVIYLADVDAVSDADGLGKIAASLDAVDCTSQTMIVAATTFPDRVDASLTAPGRFTEQVTTPGPTQPPTLGGTGNEHRPKCGDALWLGSKGGYGSFHFWINVWVAGKTVRSHVNTRHT